MTTKNAWQKPLISPSPESVPQQPMSSNGTKLRASAPVFLPTSYANISPVVAAASQPPPPWLTMVNKKKEQDPVVVQMVVEPREKNAVVPSSSKECPKDVSMDSRMKTKEKSVLLNSPVVVLSPKEKAVSLNSDVKEKKTTEKSVSLNSPVKENPVVVLSPKEKAVLPNSNVKEKKVLSPNEKEKSLDLKQKAVSIDTRVKTTVLLNSDVNPVVVLSPNEKEKSLDVCVDEKSSSDVATEIVVSCANDPVPDLIQCSTTTSVSPMNDLEQIAEIGQGAFGKVFLVRRASPAADQVFALKIIEKAALKQDKYVNSESEILRTLNHAFIVRLEHTFQCSDRLYFCMEFVSGGDLYDVINTSGFLLEDQAVFYLAELILALEYLHKENICHRDIKPENILIDGQGHVKLSDFGLAARMTEEGGLTSKVGTDFYMAPEMILKTKAYSKSVDFWALGVLAYEMLTGEVPFGHTVQKKLYAMILQNNAKFPSHLSEQARDCIKSLLNRNVEQRLGVIKSTPFEIGGMFQLKHHRFFRKIDWHKLELGEVSAPMIPTADPQQQQQPQQQSRFFLRDADLTFTDERFPSFSL